MFFIYNTYLSYHRAKQVYTLRKNGELEVRNSPLDRYTTPIAKVIICARSAFDHVPHIGGGLGFMLGMDQILKESGRDPFFGPLIGQGLNKVLPPKSDYSVWKDKLEKGLSSVDEKAGVYKSLTELISQSKGC